MRGPTEAQKPLMLLVLTMCNKSRYRGLVPFQKGKSGNPGGRTKQFAQCQRLCREASPEASRRLI
jgi:hypothetical protein